MTAIRERLAGKSSTESRSTWMSVRPALAEADVEECAAGFEQARQARHTLFERNVLEGSADRDCIKVALWQDEGLRRSLIFKAIRGSQVADADDEALPVKTLAGDDTLHLAEHLDVEVRGVNFGVGKPAAKINREEAGAAAGIEDPGARREIEGDAVQEVD